MQISESDYFTIKFDDFVVPFRTNGPAKTDSHYFKDVYINPRTLLNMINHSLSSQKEIMGFLAGHFKDQSYIVTDAVALPIEGTETRVIADDGAIWKAIQHFDDMHLLGRPEDQTGWYHSHPGLWCFFSAIDVRNHRLNQQARGGCFAGLVIDPINTSSSGKLHLGAYTSIPETDVKEIPIPKDVFFKYGQMANHYYELEIHFFKTKTDERVLNDIISRSYGQSIKASPLEMNAQYIGQNAEDAASQIKRINTPEERDEDLPQLSKKIQTINNDRKTGIWIHKMKRIVFG
ncbi:COP9 signalosome complex subunit 5a [Tritrichomonas foetus]|uniref:COP9 signalosome complex subunit 5 n=1 Tax=Tritrichomonas foetus TaxID=1144522 RepID=A0A1J4L2K9_9EUKA|nr:COP9 signalosome complex subunit 5a [Tritrichomonas foetus]|eukprot:OHT17650.1 COP9 signalosome complex subunit 5a [Tritrichomonas foetus]